MSRPSFVGEPVSPSRRGRRIETESAGACEGRARPPRIAPTPSTTFWTVAFTAFVVIGGANIPSPLYQLYREHFGFSVLAITIIFSIYALALIPSLLVSGVLGDALGRRRMLMASVSFATVGTIFLASAQGMGGLIAGRFVQGLAVGAAQGNVAAALVEMEPHGDRRRAAVVTMLSISLGGAVGPLISGLLAQYLPAPRVLAYMVELVLLGIALASLLILGKGPRPAIVTSQIRKLRVRRGLGSRFTSATLSASLAWAIGGLFLALLPTYLSELLHARNLALSGLAVTLVLAAGGVAQLAGRRRSPRDLQGIGLVGLVLGLGLVLVAVPVNWPPLVVLGSAIGGAGLGLTYLGATAEVNDLAPNDERGAVSSLYLAIAYLAMALPTIGTGLLANYLGLYRAVAVFGGVVSLATILNLAWLRRKRRCAVT